MRYPAELWSLLERARPFFGQERVFRRAVALLFAESFTLGRHTVTQLLRTWGATAHEEPNFMPVPAAGRRLCGHRGVPDGL